MRGLAAVITLWFVGLGWSIRRGSDTPNQREGSTMSCDDAGITKVALMDEDPEGEIRTFEFDCEDGHGSTDFVLPGGRHLFWIEPGGTGAEDVEVPNPIAAQVHKGEVTDLQILVIRTP
jgi:hypothetical protein